MIKWFSKERKQERKQFFAELRWFLGYSRRHPWVIVWYTLLGLLGTTMGLGTGVLGKNIIDMVTGQQTGSPFLLGGIYIGIQLLRIGLNAITGYISETIQVRVGQEIRGEIFDRIIHARWQDISKYHSGDLLARASRDTGTLAGSMIGWLPSLIINLFQFFGAFFVIFYYDPTLALLALGTAPAILLASGVTTRRMRQHSKRMHTLGSEMMSFHSEVFSNLQMIKSFGVVDAYSKKLRQVQNKQKDATLQYAKFSLLTGSVLSIVGLVVSCLCFLWSAYRLWKGYITYGEMTLFLQLAGTLSGAFGALVSMVGSTIRLTTSVGRVMEVTNLPMEEYDPPETLQKMLNQGICPQVRVEGIAFGYEPESPVITHGNMAVDPGQIVALVGPSGGGKTTMLRLLLGLLEPEEGAVRLNFGEDSFLPGPDTRRVFSYVPQVNTLFSGTIRENLTIMNPQATDEELWQALHTACAEEFVRPLGLDATVGERGSGLSQGQIQRLSIARALLSQAPILLLDEATSALDLETERKLLANLVDGRSGRACIVTTHRLSVLKNAHGAYLIRDHQVQKLSQTEIDTFLAENL